LRNYLTWQLFFN